jgi:hypothetical protein
VSHNSADQEVASIHREASNVAAATQLVPMNEIVGALSPLMKPNPRSPATRVMVPLIGRSCVVLGQPVRSSVRLHRHLAPIMIIQATAGCQVFHVRPRLVMTAHRRSLASALFDVSFVVAFSSALEYDSFLPPEVHDDFGAPTLTGALAADHA